MNILKSVRFLGLGLALIGQVAFATHGTQPIGIGAAAKGMGGAGIAFPQNSLISGYNPAAITRVKTQFDVSVAAFNPNRSYKTGSAQLNGDDKEVESLNILYVMPAMAVNWNRDSRNAFAFGMFPHGGGGVRYHNKAPFAGFNVGGNTSRKGVTTSTELQQMLIAGTYARKITDYLSLGISPLIGFQRFKATGIGYFKVLSSSPDRLSDQGFDNSLGYGARVGLHGNITDSLQIGASYQSLIKMQRFEKYEGLFAQNGRFDMAPQWAVGAAYTFFDRLTLALDYHVIEYHKVPAISNRHDYLLPEQGIGAVGGENGAGFGWDDVKIIKVGMQYDVNNNHRVRLGYSGGNSPIGPEDVLFNMLAPAVTQEHYSVGYSTSFKKGYTLDVSFVRTVRNAVRGSNPNIAGDEVEIAMDQNQLDIGLSKLF